MSTTTPIALAAVAVVTGLLAWWPATEPTAVTAADRYFGVEIDAAAGIDAIADLAERVRRIEVVVWDEERSTLDRVEARRDSRHGWILASHHDYPSDGERRVGETAGRVLGVERLVLVTDRRDQHASLGVLDPAIELAEPGARGTRVVLIDDQGASLVDLIIGKPVEGMQGQQYVREQGQDQVWTAAIETGHSARFVDWVKPNPLSLTADDVLLVQVDKYSVSQRGEVSDRRAAVFERDQAAGQWTATGAPDGKQPDQTKLNDLIRRLGELRFVEIVPRPSQTVAEGQVQDVLASQEMRSLGFYLGQNGQLFGHEGAFRLISRQGMIYEVYFGKTAGSVAEDGSSDRMVGIWATYSSEFDRTLPALDAAPAEGEDPEAARAARAAERETAISAANQRAESLNARYQTYFYVVRDSDFQNLRPDPESLLAAIPAPPSEPTGEVPEVAPEDAPEDAAPAGP